MEKEELIVTNIEETPLSEGKTLTELQNEVKENEDWYNSEKRTQLILSSLAGAGLLAACVGMMLADSGAYQVAAFIAGSIFTAGTGSLAVFNQRFLQEAREKYSQSYKNYYGNVKEKEIEKSDVEKDESRGIKR